MKNHTPGPWRYVDGCVYAGEAHGGLRLLIAIPSQPRNPDTPALEVFSAEWTALENTASANGRLIAASPDLLADLRWIAKIASASYEHDDRLRAEGARTLKRIAERAEAAITKATDKPKEQCP